MRRPIKETAARVEGLLSSAESTVRDAGLSASITTGQATNALRAAERTAATLTAVAVAALILAAAALIVASR